MAHRKALFKGFPMVSGAVFVGGYFSVCGLRVTPGRLGSVSMYCEWARVPVVFRLNGRPRVFWRAWLSVFLLPVQHWFLSGGRA
eukprot:scaffold20962_cov112-Isochrysis_galbana.AAC.6